jgi:pyrimidine-nucleoside phosphorylase
MRVPDDSQAPPFNDRAFRIAFNPRVASLVPVNFLPLLEAKRAGRPLSEQQIKETIGAFTAGRIPDYQMAAFLMAVFFRGLNAEETRALTLTMRDSGETLKFPDDPRPLVDKHSTGGVGDKVSLPLAPLLACLGFRVPMISGRGLGITGGTLDKLESIPGFSTQLTPQQIVEQVQEIGLAMAGQTATMVPADKKLYALRDATGTVPSIPLITASILSKKLAENLNALILDVKFGAAAFMPTQDEARELARSLVTLARECGVNTRALLTDMDTPLGRSAGNWLEVREAVACLEGRGPDDLRDLVIECAAHLLAQTGQTNLLASARRQAGDCLSSGRPRKKFDELIVAQGGNLDTFRRQLAQDRIMPVVRELVAHEAGYVLSCDARLIGEAVRELGGGRMTRDAEINPYVGIDELVKPGEQFGPESVLARVHSTDAAVAMLALEKLKDAIVTGDEPPPARPLVRETVE